MAEPGPKTRSGFAIEAVYGPPGGPDGADGRYEDKLGAPGQYPFTRGIYPEMYRKKLWTMRQYAGFGSAQKTNERFRYLLAQGQTGLSVALDLPTQLGYDADAKEAAGEVGRVGVPIGSLADMEGLFEGIPLGEITTSFTINATAPMLLAMYQVVAEKQGVPRERIAGTVQNDLLKEFGARGAWIFPIDASMRLVVDVIEHCCAHLPRFHPISIASHFRDAGATPAEEMALTIADGIAYVQACLARGLPVDRFAPRLSFFFYTYTNFFEEVAKYRAGRRLWARILKEELGAKSPESWRMRIACVCGGHSLTKAEPLGNITRTTIETMAVVASGVQSVFTAAFDEAFALPTELSARTALRVQQIVAHETDLAASADPLGGSYLVEALTDRMEEAIREVLKAIEAHGGMVEALKSGFVQRLIARRAYEWERRVASGEQPIVGVNRFRSGEEPEIELEQVDPALGRAQADRLATLRRVRDADAVAAALDRLERAARTTENLMPATLDAVRAYATIGEMTDRLRRVFGSYEPSKEF